MPCARATRQSKSRSTITLRETTSSCSATRTSARICSTEALRCWRSISSLREMDVMTAQILIPLLGLASFASAQEPYSQLRSTGPQTLAIAYRCNPDQRTSLRRAMEGGGVARFENWKRQGILKDYHILFNSYLDSETYDMMSLLTFADFPSVAKWREIEKTSPGGLPAEALKLFTSAVTPPSHLP